MGSPNPIFVTTGGDDHRTGPRREMKDTHAKGVAFKTQIKNFFKLNRALRSSANQFMIESIESIIKKKF
jgi:hypothetical protein